MTEQNIKQPLYVFLTGVASAFVTVVSVLFLKNKLENFHGAYFFELNSLWVSLVCMAFCFLGAMVYAWLINYSAKPKLFFFLFCSILMLIESFWVKIMMDSSVFVNILNPIQFLVGFLLMLIILL